MVAALVQNEFSEILIVKYDFPRNGCCRSEIVLYIKSPQDSSMPEDAETIKKYNNDPGKEAFEAENGGESYAVELDALAVYAPDDYIRLIQDTVDEFFDEDIHNLERDQRETPEFKKNTTDGIWQDTSTSRWL